MAVVYVLWDTFSDDYICGVYRNLADAVTFAAKCSDEELDPNEVSKKVKISADDIQKFIEYTKLGKDKDSPIKNEKVKASDESVSLDSSTSEDVNKVVVSEDIATREKLETTVADLTRAIQDILGDKAGSLDYQVVLPSSESTLIHLTYGHGLNDKLIITPITVYELDVPVWFLLTSENGGGQSYSSGTLIEYSDCLTAGIYEEFNNYMGVEHNRNDNNIETYPDDCFCHQDENECEGDYCEAELCRICEDGKSVECTEKWFLELMRKDFIRPDHCSSETGVSLLKYNII